MTFSPVTRLVFVMLFSLGLLICHSWPSLALLSCILVLFCIGVRMQPIRVARALIPLYVILICMFITQSTFGIFHALLYTLRFLELGIVALATGFSLKHDELVYALYALISPVRSCGLPVDDFVTMLSIALRFIPLSKDEYMRVSSAQQCRGKTFNEGSIIARLQAGAGVFIPLLIGLFHRADTLSCAMDARCYGASGPRSYLSETSYALKAYDKLSLISCIILLFCVAMF